MTMRTFKFDPEDVITIPMVAREVGVTPQAAHMWWRMRADKYPPLFRMDLGQKRTLVVWEGKQGRKLIKAYNAYRDAQATAKGKE